ncbi:MAG: hypothetical protein J7L54_04265, partial [Elusimicrobia bacterium]|nr:hypothetical protein [Elusimicrobiota bacterium]
MKKIWIAVTGDIVASRHIPHRDRFQRKLFEVIKRINALFKKNIEVKFSVTIGDEFQGVASSLEASYEIVKEFQRYFYPVKISFGVGAGGISTSIRKKTSEMDGKCFVLSRAALEEAKQLKQSAVYITGKKDRDIAVNTIISLI